MLLVQQRVITGGQVPKKSLVRPPLLIDQSVGKAGVGCIPNDAARAVFNGRREFVAAVDLDDFQRKSFATVAIGAEGEFAAVRADG